MFWVYAYSVRGHPDESPRLGGAQEWSHVKSWHARHVRQRLRTRLYFRRLRG